MAKRRPGDGRAWAQALKKRHEGTPGLLSSVWQAVRTGELRKRRKAVEHKAIGGQVLYKAPPAQHQIDAIARRTANSAVTALDESLRAGGYYPLPSHHHSGNRIVGRDLCLSWSDDSLRSWSETKGAHVARLVDYFDLSDPDAMLVVIAAVESLLSRYGFIYPKSRGGHLCSLAKLQDAAWWLRQARRLKVRTIDEKLRALGLVHAAAQHYVSDPVVSIRRTQNARNRAILEGLRAINQDGDEYPLSELAALSVSNPAIKRAELMLRMRGFEDIAEQLGHTGIFYTLTAPSAFHPKRQVKSRDGKKIIRVVDNPNYNGATVRDAQAWLNNRWAVIRAAWHRQGLRAYGFRVVEPHADGCPHWHLLLFFEGREPSGGGVAGSRRVLPLMSSCVAAEATKILKQKMLDQYGDESGAARHRVRVVAIDRERGSATGYIAKYIAKNIDGAHIDGDSLGLESATAAERINAWAAAHGIRQFQQIGGASVQVWRELRRMDELPESSPPTIKAAREFADSADWHAYTRLQGGPTVARSDQKIRLGWWLETSLDKNTGEEIFITKQKTKYGEPTRGAIFGVMCDGVGYLSRFYTWTIERVGNSARFMGRALRDVLQETAQLLGPTYHMSADDLQDYLRGAGYA